MTLGEYVDLICQKCRRTDNPTREEARTYIRNKYRTIYESKPWRDVSGVVAVPMAAEQVVILPQIIDRVISCRWSNTITVPNTSLYEVMTINPHRFDEVGDPLSYSIISPSGVAVAPLGQKIRATTGSSTPDFKISVHGSYNGDRVSELISMTGNATVESMYRYDEIFSLSLGERASDVEVKRADDGVQILVLDNTWENERKHQRIHFHATPQNATTALILHKRDFHPLVDDSSAPEITGMETCLEEFVMYDMRQAERQYGMAQAHLQAAGAAVQAMADLERHQSAFKVKIIPWYGFGQPVSLPGKAIGGNMPVFANNALDDQFVWDRCADFSGGMVSHAKAVGLAENQASLIYDGQIHITGQVRKRRGVSDIKTPPGPIVTDKTIQGLKWFDSPTFDKLLAAIDGQIYEYDESTGIWSILVTDAITSEDEQISMAQLSDHLFWTDSSEDGIVYYDWDDELPYVIDPSPAASILMSVSLRLVAAGVETAPNTLFFSDYLDGWSWPVIQAIGIGEDGDPITCIKKWQKYYLIVGKLQSIYMVDANPAYGNVLSFPVLEVHPSVGVIAKRTMCQVGQDMFFLSRNGVMKITPQQATDTNVMVPLPVSQPIQNIIETIRWAFAYKSCAVCYNNHYFLSVPIDSNDPDTVLVYSYITGTWAGVWRNHSIMEFCEQPYLGLTRLICGYSDGTVKEARDYIQESAELANDFTDDGVPVETVVITRAMSFKDDMSSKTPYYLEAEFFTKTGDIEVYAILDGAEPILLDEGAFSLVTAITLPVTLPVLLTKPKWVKKKFPLFYLGQFREIQIKVVGTSGNMILRSLTLSAQLDSVNFNKEFEY